MLVPLGNRGKRHLLLRVRDSETLTRDLRMMAWSLGAMPRGWGELSGGRIWSRAWTQVGLLASVIGRDPVHLHAHFICNKRRDGLASIPVGS